MAPKIASGIFVLEHNQSYLFICRGSSASLIAGMMHTLEATDNGYD